MLWLRMAIALTVLAAAGPAFAQEGDAELAHKLNNPVSDLISVPLQMNYDCCYGPSDGGRYTLNVQPVFPVQLNADWNVIIRTIVPVIYADRASPTTGSTFGLADTTQSFFFSPRASKNGLTWAIGPAFLWPTGSKELGTKKWGAGPTVLVLKQSGGTTYGLLANHIWSYADLGDNSRPDVSSTFVQPFFAYATKTATTYSINTESSYNWKTEHWTVPVNVLVSHVYKFGEQRVSLGAGARYYLSSEHDGPEWGLRAVATLLFPK